MVRHALVLAAAALLALPLSGCLDASETGPGDSTATVQGALAGAPLNSCDKANECLLRDCKGTCRVFSRWDDIHPSCKVPPLGGVCEPYEAVCSGDRCRRKLKKPDPPNPCDDFAPPGCKQTGCPGDMVCDTSGQYGCVPSACGCDPATGGIMCTADCNGGTCVPADDCGCTSHADCVKTSAGCCPCSSGGQEVAVAAQCLDTVPGCDLEPGTFGCPAVYLCTGSQPMCVEGECVLGPGGCEPVACDLWCEYGFQVDAEGCELCVCNPPPVDACGCASDADCVKATSGCCPCSMGGKEAAVAKHCLDTLPGCDLDPGTIACPAVYMCTGAQAVCLGGECTLMGGGIALE